MTNPNEKEFTCSVEVNPQIPLSIKTIKGYGYSIALDELQRGLKKNENARRNKNNCQSCEDGWIEES